MYPYIHITLPSYGVLAFIGGFFALIFLFIRLDKYEIEFVEFLKLFILCIIGGVVGSKLLFAVTQVPWLIENFTFENLILLIPQSGYVYYGGLFGVLIILWIVTRSDLEKRNRIFRLITPSIPLFHGFGRIGCMMAGCCYGLRLTEPFYFGFMEFDRVPVQLIESAFEFLMFIVFVVFEKRNSELYSLSNYLVIYAIFRFVVEFYRGDEVRGIWMGGLSTAQLISVLIVIIVLFTKNKKQFMPLNTSD